nr:hypothetical protein [uncultured Oscillibacter sp.]
MTGFEKEKAAFTVDGSESGTGKQDRKGLVSAAIIPKPGQDVKSAARAAFWAERLSVVVQDALLDMPMEPGGSAVLRGEETTERGKRWYFCVTGESPMTEQSAARVVKSLLELSADVLRGLSPEEAAAAAAALRRAAEGVPLWCLVCGGNPCKETAPEQAEGG